MYDKRMCHMICMSHDTQATIFCIIVIHLGRLRKLITVDGKHTCEVALFY